MGSLDATRSSIRYFFIIKSTGLRALVGQRGTQPTLMNAERPESASNSFVGSVLIRYHRQLFRFLMRRLRNSQQVQDLAQEVYLRLLRVENHGDIQEPLAYVYRTAGNVVAEYRLRQHREDKRMQFDSDATEWAAEHSPHLSPDEHAEQLNSELTLKRVLEALPPMYRDVLILRACRGLAYKEIALQLSLSVHTAEKYYFKALASVRAADWKL